MCGIGLLNSINNFNLLSYRGPHNSYTEELYNYYSICFHRLSINDLSDNGNQPFIHNDNYFVCNGEIYNYIKLKNYLDLTIDFQGESDCEVVFHLLNNQKFSTIDLCKKLDGDFAFVHVNYPHDSNPYVIAARDPIGVRPLYFGFNSNNSVEFCSEIKGFHNVRNIQHFPPGHVWINGTICSYQPLTLPKIPQNNDYDCEKIKSLLINSVKKRLLSDQPLGFFLSGGLDSSIIAAIGAKLLHPQKIKTFSIGVKGSVSPDLIAAAKVAKFLNTDHHVYEFTIEEALHAIQNTIWHLESYDCTTIRASVPMFLLSKYVSENFDCKVILSGEGADELFGGYIYFHDAPNETEFQKETIRLIENVHQFDVLRADRCTAGNGLELRVPFFDKEFIEYITNISPIFKVYKKNWMEKTILRRSFEGMLPPEILWRQKNGMSDAVGYSWVDAIKDHVKNQKITIESFNDSKYNDYSKNKPLNEEELWYRMIYTSLFPNTDCIGGIWRPQWTMETDPSARKLKQFLE